jgi:hypothetical protein
LHTFPWRGACNHVVTVKLSKCLVPRYRQPSDVTESTPEHGRGEGWGRSLRVVRLWGWGIPSSQRPPLLLAARPEDVRCYWPRRMNSVGVGLANALVCDIVSGWKLPRILAKLFSIDESNVLLTLCTIFEWTLILSAETKYSQCGVCSKCLAQWLQSVLRSGIVKCDRTLRLEAFLHPFTDTTIPTWFLTSLGYGVSLKDVQTIVRIYKLKLFFFVRRTYLSKDYNFESNTGRQWKKTRRFTEEFVLRIQR